jgi:hypothetical protein
MEMRKLRRIKKELPKAASNLLTAARRLCLR